MSVITGFVLIVGMICVAVVACVYLACNDGKIR
jgi:hypothetical protein